VSQVVSNSGKTDRAINLKMHGQPVVGFAWVTLGFNIAVILWGAYVRATGSGAGCGNHWPLCNGDVLPKTPQVQTIIEFTHRVTSGLAFISVVALFVWCWRKTSKGAVLRFTAALALCLMINEALLGALLVKFNHVAQDTSTARAVFLSMHFANTLLLLACLASTAYLLSSGPRKSAIFAKPGEMIMIGAGLFAAMVMGVTGSLAALGDTLFPAASLRSALIQDFSLSSYYLVRLRWMHPLAAVSGGLYIFWLIRKSFTGRTRSGLPILVTTLLVVQVGLGAINVLLLAPVWLQLVHLFVADMFWISLVLASADLILGDAMVHRFTMDLPSEQRAV
jgi:cytochrome c oxidase assembly protein subunit 15